MTAELVRRELARRRLLVDPIGRDGEGVREIINVDPRLDARRAIPAEAVRLRELILLLDVRLLVLSAQRPAIRNDDHGRLKCGLADDEPAFMPALDRRRIAETARTGAGYPRVMDSSRVSSTSTSGLTRQSCVTLARAGT